MPEGIRREEHGPVTQPRECSPLRGGAVHRRNDTGGASTCLLGAADTDDEFDFLKAHVEKLPPRQRDAVWLRIIEGRTPSSVARITGVSRATVLADYDAGMDALRVSLGDYYYGGRTCHTA